MVEENPQPLLGSGLLWLQKCLKGLPCELPGLKMLSHAIHIADYFLFFFHYPHLQVEVHERAIRNIFIINTGKFNFDYKWDVHEHSTHKDMLRLSPLEGGVNHSDRQKCVLSFCPPCKTTLRGCELALKVRLSHEHVRNKACNKKLLTLALFLLFS